MAEIFFKVSERLMNWFDDIFEYPKYEVHVLLSNDKKRRMAIGVAFPIPIDYFEKEPWLLNEVIGLWSLLNRAEGNGE